MRTLRSAFLCALSAIVLFSCSTKTKNEPVQKDSPIKNSQVVQTLPKEGVNMNAWETKFIENAAQHFFVSAKRISLITSRGGLKITVDPAALERENGTPVDGNIHISVIELTNVHDLFKSNAVTVSDGRLLASGGSYFIGMENDGYKVRIRNGKALEAEFPVLKKEEMELFYGQRNESNEMNWKVANVPFKKQFEFIGFSDAGKQEINTGGGLEELIEPKIYKGLDETVYYYKTRMTLQKLVDTLNHRDAKVYLQTISYWPKNLPVDKVLDTNYLTHLYGPRKQYILKSCRQEEKQKAAMEKWQPQTIAGQIQKNYAPTSLTSLGWMNCDRFYNVPEKVETNVDVPYAFNNGHIEYFILFKRFNGLMSGSIDLDDKVKMVLSGMPAGEEVTMIAFTKKNGIIYQAKEDFVIEKNKTLPVCFKEVSAAGMNKIFGFNVRI